MQGGKPIPKGEILELENKTNLHYDTDTDLIEIKRILLNQIVESKLELSFY